MSDSNSFNLAISTIQKINNVKKTLRATATSCLAILSTVDSVIVNQEKKNILIDGLNGLDITPNDLAAEKDTLMTICQDIKKNVPELTE